MCCGRTTTNQETVWQVTKPNGSLDAEGPYLTLSAARTAASQIEKESSTGGRAKIHSIKRKR